jgi:uncharacterized protein YndB with AHSA1/START domain
MEAVMNSIQIDTKINAPIDKVWECWTKPEHITQWNNASDDWHTPHAENELRVGGKFLARMEAKDGSVGFDFSGKYTSVIPQELIEYELDDGRNVKVEFHKVGTTSVHITETFDAEEINSLELQKNGWQSILDNFKKYTEKI